APPAARADAGPARAERPVVAGLVRGRLTLARRARRAAAAVVALAVLVGEAVAVVVGLVAAHLGALDRALPARVAQAFVDGPVAVIVHAVAGLYQRQHLAAALPRHAALDADRDAPPARADADGLRRALVAEQPIAALAV